MIKVNKIEIQTVELFDPNDQPLGFVNEDELADIKLQIAQQKAEGYYVVFNDEKIMITTQGGFVKHPKGLFDHKFMCYSEIIKLRLRETEPNK